MNIQSDRERSRGHAIEGAGIDARPERRPGVPMETEPRPIGHAHWDQPSRQRPHVRVLKRANLEQLTPVFGTAQPPRLLSGVLRRIAYRVPEHRVTHWALLLLGDRVDVLEHRLGRLLRVGLPLAAAGVAVLAMAPAAGRRRRRRGLFR